MVACKIPDCKRFRYTFCKSIHQRITHHTIEAPYIDALLVVVFLLHYVVKRLSTTESLDPLLISKAKKLHLRHWFPESALACQGFHWGIYSKKFA